MTAKRVSFDMMNLGFPVNTDSFESENLRTQNSQRYSDVYLPDKLLRKKLAEEAKNINSDFLLRDPSSSDDSDDYAFPETIQEQVRRMSFAKRRKRHYTEFATVDLARRLVCAEFASPTSSVNGDSDFRSQDIEEECSPCWPQEPEFIPYIQYQAPNNDLPGSEDPSIKEDLEPGFDPSHPCFHKLVGEVGTSFQTRHDRTLAETDHPSDALSELKAGGPSVMALADISKDLGESLERQTRVLGKSDKWDLQPPSPNPLFPLPEPRGRSQVSIRSEKSGNPVGFRSL